MSEMVLYRGRHVPKESFRAFVYGKDNSIRLAKSWDEYEILVSSGLWSSEIKTIEEPIKEERKKKPKGGE